MEHRDWKNSLQETAGRHASRRGAFSAGLTALAVAAVLVFNLLAAQLPEQWAQIDLTGTGEMTVPGYTFPPGEGQVKNPERSGPTDVPGDGYPSPVSAGNTKAVLSAGLNTA